MNFPVKSFVSTLSTIRDGVVWKLPTGWSIDNHGAYEFNGKLEDKAFAHGSNLVGDMKVSGRTITLTFDMQESTEEEYDNAMNDAYLHLTGAFELVSGREDRVYHVAGCKSIKLSEKSGFKQRWGEVEVALFLADPFRYAIDETVIITTFTEEQTQSVITFNNPSSVDVPIIATFIPAAEIPEIKIEHVESGQYFEVKDSLLTAPATLKVNCEDGTVWRDNDNAINAFTGLFLHVLPGTNTFKYTGKAGTVKIAYTAGWFI